LGNRLEQHHRVVVVVSPTGKGKFEGDEKGGSMREKKKPGRKGNRTVIHGPRKAGTGGKK